MSIKQTLHFASSVVLLLSLAVSSVVFMKPTSAYAADVCGTETTILDVQCKSGSNKVEDNPIWGILLLIITIMTAGVGLLAVAGFVYGAILYTTAQNNSGQITKAKETIANVIIGIVLYALMWSLLQFLIPGGVFG